MAFEIKYSAATPEGIVIWLTWDPGDDPAKVPINDFTVIRGTKRSDPNADLRGWLGAWDDRGHFVLVPGPQAGWTPQDGDEIRTELNGSFSVTQVLPAGELEVFNPRPGGQDFLDRAERIADSAEKIEVHAGTATADTGRIAADAGRIADSAEQLVGDASELVAYPLLTSDAGSPGGGTTSLSGAAAQALIERNAKALVPNLPRALNPTSDDGREANRLEAAIIRATEPVVVNGITKFVPRKNPYGVADTSVGEGLAGAQASLVVFAQAQLEASLPLVDSLRPLDVTSDPEVVEADTAILRRTWVEFVNELSRDGGPRVQRANALANKLDGLDDAGVNPNPVLDANGEPMNVVETLGEELGMLARDPATGLRVPNRAPLNNLNVVTVDEEKALTDYETLEALIQSATATWRRLRPQIAQPLALGTGLVRLRRLFQVLGESVEEAQTAFDSVFFDDDQRRTQPIGPGAGQMAVQDLFDWLSTFANEEGPGLVHEGGTRGMAAVNDTTGTLLATLGGFRNFIAAGPPAPAVLRHPRIANALDELDTCLQNIDQATQ